MIQFAVVGTKRTWPVLLLVLAPLLAETGCGLFSIRDPVAPVDPGPEIPRRTPTEPEDVLFNFEEAVKHKVDGLSQYAEALHDDFHLVLDIIDVQELGIEGVDSLSKQRDLDAQRIWSQDTCAVPADCDADSFYFAFDNQQPSTETDTTAFYLDIPYELQFIVQQNNSVSATLAGKAELTMVKDEQTTLWSLRRWVDKREEPNTSFGRWHGERAPQP
jgi:hypothetical protein